MADQDDSYLGYERDSAGAITVGGDRYFAFSEAKHQYPQVFEEMITTAKSLGVPVIARVHAGDNKDVFVALDGASDVRAGMRMASKEHKTLEAAATDYHSQHNGKKAEKEDRVVLVSGHNVMVYHDAEGVSAAKMIAKAQETGMAQLARYKGGYLIVNRDSTEAEVEALTSKGGAATPEAALDRLIAHRYGLQADTLTFLLNEPRGTTVKAAGLEAAVGTSRGSSVGINAGDGF